MLCPKKLNYTLMLNIFGPYLKKSMLRGILALLHIIWPYNDPESIMVITPAQVCLVIMLIRKLISFPLPEQLSLTASTDSDHILPISSQKDPSSTLSSSSQWSSSLAVSLVRPQSREVSQGSSKAAEGEAGTNLLVAPARPGRSSPSLSRFAGGLPLQAQVARSELNVRLPRGT